MWHGYSMVAAVGAGLTLARFGQRDREFEYSTVIDESTSQDEVFDAVGRHLCERVLDGHHANLFVTGQNGSGKVHTAVGSVDEASWARSFFRVFLPHSVFLCLLVPHVSPLSLSLSLTPFRLTA